MENINILSYSKVFRGSKVKIYHIIGEALDPMIKRIGYNTYEFLQDAYVLGQLATDGEFFHARHAVKMEKDKELDLDDNNVKFWPRLRRALEASGVKRVNVPGGAYPLHYEDEIVVPDYKVSGSYYYIIKTSDIGKYLKNLSLDERGKKRREEEKKRKEEEERRRKDPHNIAEKIGDKLDSVSTRWSEKPEFFRLTFVSSDGTKFSTIHPTYGTDLAWDGCGPRIVCEAFKENGVQYLNKKALGIKIQNHSRIKKCEDWGGTYLMPSPEIATQVCEGWWYWLFSHKEHEGVDVNKIISAEEIILEAFDIYDALLPERYVYEKKSDSKRKEFLMECSSDSLEGSLLSWASIVEVED